MPDLGRQLHNYYEATVQLSDPDDIITGTVTIDVGFEPVVGRTWWQRAPVVAAAAAVVVLVLIGGIALLIGRGEPDVVSPVSTTVATTVPSATVPSTTVPPATAPPTTTASVVQEPMTWSRAPFDGRVDFVVAGGPGLIAVGVADDTKVLWTSADGKTWTRVPLDEAVFGGYRIHDLVATPDGYAAIGTDGKTSVAAWTSLDGVEWVRNSVDGFAQSEVGRLSINGLTYGPSGYVAVGWTSQPDQEWMLDDHIVIHSPDGTVWQRTNTTDLPLGGMKDVAVHGSGYLAFGVDWSGEGEPGVWESADGLNWTLIDVNVEQGSDDGLLEFQEVAVADDGQLYAFANGPVWVSENGSNWTRLGQFVGEPEDGFAGAWGAAANQGVVSGDRIVLVGSLEVRGFDEPDRAAVWASEDGGITWERMSRPLEVFGDLGSNEMGSVAEIDGTYVAFGKWNGEASVWVGAWNED